MKNFHCLQVVAMTAICLLFSPSCIREKETPVFATIQLKTSLTLGNLFNDTVNYTLYYFSNDFDGKSNCTGGCLNVWPVYDAGDNLTQAKLVSGLDLSDFGTITTSTGAKQTTYKSWPLYYYAPLVNGTNVRENAGETKGERVGNIWFVAKPDYSIMNVGKCTTCRQ